MCAQTNARVSNEGKTQKTNHLYNVAHVVQSNFLKNVYNFISTNPTTLILSSLVSEFWQRIQI